MKSRLITLTGSFHSHPTNWEKVVDFENSKENSINFD